MIRITTKKDGFRRAGMAHHGTQDYADEYFSAAQLTALRADPMLVVEDVEDVEGVPDEGAEGAEGAKTQKSKKAKGAEG